MAFCGRAGRGGGGEGTEELGVREMGSPEEMGRETGRGQGEELDGRGDGSGGGFYPG